MVTTMGAPPGLRKDAGRKAAYEPISRESMPGPNDEIMTGKERGVSGSRKVFICSPYRVQGGTEEQRKKGTDYNVDLARFACRYAVRAGCVPYAPHLYFPQILNDDDGTEREIGITLGLTWLARCDELWVIEHRLSEGMQKEIRQAEKWGIPVKHFCLPRNGEERLLDEIFTPEIRYHEMKLEEK